MSEHALDTALAGKLRAGYRASRRMYLLGAWSMTGLTLGLAAMCAAVAAWGSLALVGVFMAPLWLFVAYRAFRFARPALLEQVIAAPDRVTSILKLVTPRTRMLGVELSSGELVSLRFASEAELDEARAGLAARAPNATVVPPLERG